MELFDYSFPMNPVLKLFTADVNMATLATMIPFAMVFCVMLPSTTALPEQGVWNILRTEVRDNSVMYFLLVNTENLNCHGCEKVGDVYAIISKSVCTVTDSQVAVSYSLLRCEQFRSVMKYNCVM